MTAERKNEILNLMIDWLDYHDLPDLVEELMNERYELDTALSDGVVFIDDHTHDIEDKLMAWQDVIGLSKEEMVELGIMEMYEDTRKIEKEKDTLKLSDTDIAYLKKIGHTDEDIPQIEEALNTTIYTVADVEKTEDGTTIIPDEDDDKVITAQEAREILGDKTFLSGLSRSAFHWTSGRYNDDETKYVSFDSSKLFKESKKVEAKRQLKEGVSAAPFRDLMYDAWQMDAEPADVMVDRMLSAWSDDDCKWYCETYELVTPYKDYSDEDHYYKDIFGNIRDVSGQIADDDDEELEESKKQLKENEPKYQWVLQGNYGYGWDDLVTYDNKEEAEEDYKTYREEEPQYKHRIKKVFISEEKEIKTEVKENSDDVYPKYEFTKEDADYIQKLAGDTLNIIFRDDTFQGVSYGGKIDIELRPTKYIDSGIVNLNDEFYKDVEEYVQKQYPNAELQLNNTGSVMWLRPKKDEKPSRPTSKIENKLEEALSDELPDWLRSRLNKNVLTHYKSRYSNERVPVMNLAWDKAKYVPSEIPQSARAAELKDNSKLPVFKLKIPSRYGNNEPKTEIYVPGLLDPEIHGDLVNSKSYYVPVSKVSYKQLLPYIDEFGYIELNDINTSELRQARSDAKKDTVERDRERGQHATRDYLGDGKYSDEIKWVTDNGYDKSGYPLDPDRQLKKLAKMSLENEEAAANRIETIYKQIEEVRTKVANVLTNKNINDLTGNSDADKWDTKMYRIERAVRYLGDAVKSYTNILKTVDDAKESDENWIDSWLAREFKSEIVNIRDDLKECNDCLKEFESAE